MSQDPECVREHQGHPIRPEDGMVNANDTLPNVFVYVKSGAQNEHFATPRRAVTLDQKGCIYIPHVLGIMVGQPLKVVNSDFTTHNIHVMPKNNPQWNQSQPPGAAPFYKKFAHPEVMIPVRCNEHPWMKAYIGVVDNPFYAVTGKDGSFSLKGLPPGDYTIEVWTATFGTQERHLVVRAGEPTPADFPFENRCPRRPAGFPRRPSRQLPVRARPAPRVGPSRPPPASRSRWPPSTRPGPRPSGNCTSTTSTSATGGWPSTAGSARSIT